MKLTIKDYIIFVLLFLFVSSGVFYNSGLGTLKKENNKLQTTIQANNRQIDNISADISNLKIEIEEQLFIVEKQKNELTELKIKNQSIIKKYEKILSSYNTLSSDDKWIYFRTIINYGN